MLCQLCQTGESIENSHIIPKFVSQWLKETSPLGGLRDADIPNRRQEDTTKIPLLCLDCEQRFGKREEAFRSEIFIPFSDSGILEFTYSDWLLYFAISLSWRVGCSLLDKVRIANPTMAIRVESVLQTWSDILLEKASAFTPYAHHLFFDSMYHSVLFAGPSYNERYALRTIHYAIPYGNDDLAIFVKLPGMVFYSGIQPADPPGWENTRISSRGRIVVADQAVTDPFFWKHITASTIDLATSMASMSEKQKQRLDQQMQSAKPQWQIRRDREKK